MTMQLSYNQLNTTQVATLSIKEKSQVVGVNTLVLIEEVYEI